MRSTRTCWAPALACALFLLSLAATVPAQQAPDSVTADVDMTWGVKIPMRDGVLLNATVFRPHAQRGPLPVVFTFTPYISDSYTDRAMYFARHGYVYALVDVRGRGNSGGPFAPFENEGRDGYDVVEWFAKQPYCDGKVAMWGGSYAGFDQWTVAKEFPPHLATIVPAAAVYPGVDFPFLYGTYYAYDLQWLTFTSGATGNVKLFENFRFWDAKFKALYDAHRAFASYDTVVGNPLPVFHKWLAHPTPDAYLDAMVPTPADYRRLTIPILTITGDYDGDQPGALTYYRRHMRYGTAEDRARHYLIIGPWDHPGTRTPRAEVGGLTFARASVLDLNKLHTEWFDWTMKAGRRPAFLKKRVAYFVTGKGVWKYADSLEAIATGTRTYYLTSDGSATDPFHSGSLVEHPARGAASDRWVYDPLDTRPGDAEVEEPGYLTSQRGIMHLYGESVVYHSPAFTEATEITGVAKLTVWLSMDVPDTDLQATLYVILPNGSSVMLTRAEMRARYRESRRHANPVPIGRPQRYVFDNFTFFSREIAKGGRLRLVVGSINSPAWEKNYNAWATVATETGADAKTAHITLLHDASHPSTLELPIVR